MNIKRYLHLLGERKRRLGNVRQVVPHSLPRTTDVIAAGLLVIHILSLIVEIVRLNCLLIVFLNRQREAP